LPKLTSAADSNVAGSTRPKLKRGITQSSSLEPLDKQRDIRDKPEVLPIAALKSLRGIVLAIQTQINNIVEQLASSEDDA